MPRAKKATISPRVPLSVPDVELSKAQVSVPPPGGVTRYALLGSQVNNDVVSYSRRQQLAIYYEIYRQHPVVRAAIDKKSALCVGGGWHYVPFDSEAEINKDRATELDRFFRASSGRQLLRLTYKDLFIYGESFWFIQRSVSGKPLKALRLNPRYMTTVVEDGMIIGWKYGAHAQGEITYDDSEILHFKYDDPEDETAGMSPLHAIQRAVTQDIYAMEYNQNFFANAAQTGTIFIVKTSSQGEAERNRAWLEENYVGPENAHRPLLLEGDVTVASSVSSAHDMEFLNGRTFNREEIMMVLEMDPSKLGIVQGSNRSFNQNQAQNFQSEVVWPTQAIIEEEINNKLIAINFGWDDITFQHRESDPRRAGEQAALWNLHQNAGRLSPNDGRKQMGLPPVKGGDVYAYMTPAGLIPLEMIEATAENQLAKQQANNAIVPDPVSGLNTTSDGARNAPAQKVNDKAKNTDGN